jgi:hypothetical protein
MNHAEGCCFDDVFRIFRTSLTFRIFRTLHLLSALARALCCRAMKTASPQLVTHPRPCCASTCDGGRPVTAPRRPPPKPHPGTPRPPSPQVLGQLEEARRAGADDDGAFPPFPFASDYY